MIRGLCTIETGPDRSGQLQALISWHCSQFRSHLPIAAGDAFLLEIQWDLWHVFFRGRSCLLNCVLQRVLSLMQIQCTTGFKLYCGQPFHGTRCVCFSPFLVFVVPLWRFLCFLHCLARLPVFASPSFSVSLQLSSSLCLCHCLSLTPVDLDPHLHLEHSSCGHCCERLFLRLVLSHLRTLSHSVCLPFPVSVLVETCFLNFCQLETEVKTVASVSRFSCSQVSMWCSDSGGRSWDEASVSLLWRHTLVDALIENVDRVAPSSGDIRRSLGVAAQEVLRRAGSPIWCLEQCPQLGCGGVVQGSCALCGLLALELQLPQKGTSFVEGRLNLVDVLAKHVDVPMWVWIRSHSGSRSCTLVCQLQESQ